MTTDGGTTWTSVTIPLNWDNVHFTRGQAWYDLILAVAPDNENILYLEDGDSKVGLGVVEPDTKLHVQGSVYATSFEGVFYGGASALLAASVFHFNRFSIKEVKQFLSNKL